MSDMTGAAPEMMRLVKAAVECPTCGKRFHQIDSTEERALAIVRAAKDKHLTAEHWDVPSV